MFAYTMIPDYELHSALREGLKHTFERRIWLAHNDNMYIQNDADKELFSIMHPEEKPAIGGNANLVFAHSGAYRLKVRIRHNQVKKLTLWHLTDESSYAELVRDYCQKEEFVSSEWSVAIEAIGPNQVTGVYKWSAQSASWQRIKTCRQTVLHDDERERRHKEPFSSDES
ncbi:hypothetical protein [Roseibium sp.]|uniref:hypothetical protein n=1 Tax=Roseibium sp. TaxID=1936156 RepID=UPI003BAB16CE